MTIKQQGGIFGRNPSFNNVDAESFNITTSFSVATDAIYADAATGFAGFGTVSPERNIHVNCGTSNLAALFESTDAGAYVGFKDNTSTSQMLLGAIGDELLFYSGSVPSEAARFNASGNLAFPSGQGIDFSATSGTGTSELFDDYEEGTWTPVVADASSGGNAASGTFYGHYTKVGNLVTVIGSLRDINTSGMTTGNPIYVQGLPYACSSLTGTIMFTGSVQATSLSFTGFVSGSVADGTSYLRFFDTSSGGGFSTVPLSAITSGTTDIYFTTTYQA